MKNDKPIKWLELTFRFLDNPLKDLPSYIENNKIWIDEEKNKLNNNMKKWSEESPLAQSNEIGSYDYFEDDIIRIHKNYEEVFFNSLLIVSYSQFEIAFKSICLETEKFISRQIKLKDLQGNDYISRSKVFVEKVLEIDLQDLNTSWSKIKDYQKVRNKIVHNNGRIEQSQVNDFKQILDKYENIKLVEYDAIEKYHIAITHSDYIVDFCQILNQYLDKIKTRIIEKLK